MVQFKIRRLAYSGTAAGSRTLCVAVFLFNDGGDPIDVLSTQRVTALGKDLPKADLHYLSAFLDELRGLRSKPEAIVEFVATRLGEASLSLVLADPISIEESDCEAARRHAATYLLQSASSASRGGAQAHLGNE